MAQQNFLHFLKIKATKLLLFLAITLLMLHLNNLNPSRCEFLYLYSPFGIENFLLGKNT